MSQKLAYQMLVARGKFSGSVAAALRKRKAREANRPANPPAPGRILRMMAEKRRWRIVPLGDHTAERYLDHVRKAKPYSALRNWEGGIEASELRTEKCRVWSEGSNSDWKRRSTFRRGVLVHSVARILSPQLVELETLLDSAMVKAPRGYRWDQDVYGIKLVNSRGEDYHPTVDDLIAGGRAVADMLKVGIMARKAAAAKERKCRTSARKAELEGAMVCVADSLRAGNCYAGTQQWARKHGLDIRAHYRPSQIAKLVSTDSRVAPVIARAMRRHRQEMSKGYCVVADHRVSR